MTRQPAALPSDLPLRPAPGGVLLDLKVTPNSSKPEMLDAREGRLRIKIDSAPEHGKANAALIAFLAKTFSVPRKNISIVRGEKSREKTVFIEGHK